MPQVSLPDGSKRDYENPITVAEIAESIGAGLAKAALAGRVDGTLVDTSYVVKSDAEVAIVTERDEDGIRDSVASRGLGDVYKRQRSSD